MAKSDGMHIGICMKFSRDHHRWLAHGTKNQLQNIIMIFLKKWRDTPAVFAGVRASMNNHNQFSCTLIKNHNNNILQLIPD
ncbi:hypothetical protein NQ315_015107 [Exocentrus adspersus]|uniref:Uncharacterized protein n=1 Tax=Exocentrus adspersus TaxID=1586481 RepID=A0AAV8V9Y1_9CUCU|nr:hypothetical protein NQ315_015107 [Exocentrus adspersus]